MVYADWCVELSLSILSLDLGRELASFLFSSQDIALNLE